MDPLKIERAKKEDASLILELIQCLAVYERAPDEVQCTVADIERDGFGPNPVFEALIARLDGKPVGFALYYFKWSTWNGRRVLHLEDLFVKPEARGHGVGIRLLQTLAGIAVDCGCLRFDWEVLDWNASARDFYHRMGAHYRTEWLTYRLEGENLRRFAHSE